MRRPAPSKYALNPVCVYSVSAPDNFDGRETFGKLFFAEVKTLEGELHSEIGSILLTEHLPDRWTYPEIQPKLLAEAQLRGICCAKQSLGGAQP